jgi:hypothetical protein
MGDECVDYALKYAPLVESLQNGEMNWLLDYDKPVIQHFLKTERDVLRRYCKALECDFQQLYKAALPAALQDPDFAERLVSIENALRAVTRSAARRRIQLLFWRVLQTRLSAPRAAEQLPQLLTRMQGLRATLAQSTL